MLCCRGNCCTVTTFGGSLVTKIKKKKKFSDFGNSYPGTDITSYLQSLLICKAFSGLILVDKTTHPHVHMLVTKKQRLKETEESVLGYMVVILVLNPISSPGITKALSWALDILLRLAMSIFPLSLHIIYWIYITQDKEMKRVSELQ